MVQKVAVIGAGASGLTSIKAAVEEGFDVVCFEQEDEIGGLWHYTDNESHSSVCKSTVINTSKEMMSYSDFPAPKDFPVYMHNTKVMEYLSMYAAEFDLLKYIRFNTKIKEIKRGPNFDVDGKWEITYHPVGKDIVGQKTEMFDFVYVCTGHHWQKNIPKFDGIENFKGRIIHSKQYKDFQGFEDKVVLVVGVVFDDGTEMQDVGAIVLATGYKIGFPCLEEGLVSVENNKVPLYKYVFPYEHSKHTMAIIGCLQPIGALMPLSDLQARWAAKVFKGERVLPSNAEMKEKMEEKQIAMSKNYYQSERHTIQVNYIEYSDEIAKEIGCCPNLLQLFLKDPLLALRCFFGPCAPYQYRLTGPHSWSGAKKALEAIPENTIFPTKTRMVKEEDSHSWLKALFLLTILIGLLSYFSHMLQ